MIRRYQKNGQNERHQQNWQNWSSMDSTHFAPAFLLSAIDLFLTGSGILGRVPNIKKKILEKFMKL